MTAGWHAFDDPRIELSFRYPDPTPGGQAVRKIDAERDGALIVHYLTEDRELYFELRRYPRLTAHEEYGRHRVYLEDRFGAGAVSPLTETTLAGRPSHTYSFRWPEGERVSIVLSTGAATYRIIYNSASSLNAEVLATVEIIR